MDADITERLRPGDQHPPRLGTGYVAAVPDHDSFAGLRRQVT